MRIFLDTSAWIKFFLDEAGSTRVRQFLAQQGWSMETNQIAVSPITYAEVLATLARAVRGQRISPEGFEGAHQVFEKQWASVKIVEVNAELIAQSGQLAKDYGLRGCDAFQLATALQVQTTLFIGADLELNDTARTCGLTVWNPSDELPELAAVERSQPNTG